ncbi:MAG: winged helix DNA-binding domain-containing protein [Acidimicrobiia bacterium]|nr:winged helix DNA-binding domain-containing protein [Acidimicrobiia bacterium]
MRRIMTEERRARLGMRHGLAGPGESVTEVARDLVGLHSSDPATVYLSAHARVQDFSVPELEHALYEDRTLLRMLGMRRTMFVVPHDVAAVMDAACTKLLAPAERRRLIRMLEDQGVADDGAAWLADVEAKTMAALEARGEATATQLRSDMPEFTESLRFGEGKTWGGFVGVSTRVLFFLATAGKIVRARPRGSWISSQYRWVLLDDWIGGSLPEIDRDEAQAELVRRWLAAFGPGTFTDVKWWTGWTVRDTKAALDAVGAVEVELDDGVGLVLPDDLGPVGESEDWVALLPGLDPTPMGWKERDWYFGNHVEPLFDRNGNAGPTVWWNGRVVGGWAQRKDTGEVVYRLLEDVPSEVVATVDAKAGALRNWLGDVRVTSRFPTPLDQELRA